MGIKHFFWWFKNRFRKSISELKKSERLNVEIDNFLIDMNGIFHESAQKIYEYGAFKPLPRLLGPEPKPKENLDHLVFKDICATLEKVIHIVNPKKRIILCIDGPAPIAKQCQQRSRRFLSSLSPNPGFDSNCITPGTEFMDKLSKYIDRYIRNKKTNLEIIFSNEKVPGEGEHKLLNYVRKHGNKNESYCIHGMDADLIMLALGTHFPKFYIFREEMMIQEFEYYCIDIGSIRIELAELMRWGNKGFVPELAINDFIFMCFAVGNDFLPHIPGIEIAEGGIEFMLDVYKNTSSHYGHLTCLVENKIRFRRSSLTPFLGTIGQHEHLVFERKLKSSSCYTDSILEKCTKEGKLDFEMYKTEYYTTKFENNDLSQICHQYLQGMQWVLTYYIEGISDWRWKYDYHYAPFSSTLAKHVKTFVFSSPKPNYPTLPFIQLLSVLSPASSLKLLPPPLNQLSQEGGCLEKYFPKEFKIDMEGVKNSWEATVILPHVDYEEIENVYRKYIGSVSDLDKKRNIIGKTFLYNNGKVSIIDI